MKNSDSSSRLLFCVIFVMTIVSCTENQITPKKTISTISAGDIFDGRAGDLPKAIPENDNWRYPYPDIIAREFIPRDPSFADKKCLAWRITWPEYEGSADDNKIPTVFGLNGALSSFDYLNSVDPGNTHSKVFSLYYNNKVETAFMLWAELDHEDALLMEMPFFVLSDQSLDDIKHWVTERPSLFETHWPVGEGTGELDYSEGDFIQFALANSKLFGGIRIVSMTPRIIEVYLAVPNN
jgi:hypothetical protein